MLISPRIKLLVSDRAPILGSSLSRS